VADVLSSELGQLRAAVAFPLSVPQGRDALVAAEPAVYLLPGTSDLRFNWVVARLARLDVVTMEERVSDTWAMCVVTLESFDWTGWSKSGAAS